MRCGFISVLALGAVVSLTSLAQAREAAFLEPGTVLGAAGGEAVKVEPKADIDVGETVLNVAKRASVFFSNATNTPVKIEKLVANGDANVTAEVTSNDCLKQGSIAPGSRCSVEVSVTPSQPGSWNVDVLMTHNSIGRLTRARLTGKTSGSASGSDKSLGLTLSSKETKPVDFGDVNVGSGKIVRSALMINDGAEPITLYSIDVIEADNGLQRLDQGCAVDMELPPGASCPVTLLWVPNKEGPVSTDLIIRHSGKMGFAVVPLRGKAKGDKLLAAGSDSSAKITDAGKSGGKSSSPLPPSAGDLEKALAERVLPVDGAALGGYSGGMGTMGGSSSSSSGGSGGDGRLHLIGTIGERAVIAKPDGDTAVVQIGDEFDANGKTVKLIAVTPKRVTVTQDGVRKDLQLETSDSLVAKARAEADAAAKNAENERSKSSSRSSSQAAKSVSLGDTSSGRK